MCVSHQPERREVRSENRRKRKEKKRRADTNQSTRSAKPNQIWKMNMSALPTDHVTLFQTSAFLLHQSVWPQPVTFMRWTTADVKLKKQLENYQIRKSVVGSNQKQKSCKCPIYKCEYHLLQQFMHNYYDFDFVQHNFVFFPLQQGLTTLSDCKYLDCICWMGCA